MAHTCLFFPNGWKLRNTLLLVVFDTDLFLIRASPLLQLEKAVPDFQTGRQFFPLQSLETFSAGVFQPDHVTSSLVDRTESIPWLLVVTGMVRSTLVLILSSGNDTVALKFALTLRHKLVDGW